MTNYAGNADSALATIREKGLVLPCKRRQAPGDYDPVRGEPISAEPWEAWNTVGVVLPATLPRFRGIDTRLASDKTLVLQNSRLLLIAARSPVDDGYIPSPEPEDRFTFDGSDWRVVGASSVNPAGTPILYKVAVTMERGAA